MNKLTTFFLTILISTSLFSQQTEIFWSPFGDKEKKEALMVADKFLRSYLDSDFQSIQDFIPSNEVNFGGNIWLPTQQFLQMVQQLRGKTQLEIGEISAYTMNDTEENPDIKEETLRIYRMFSNLSVFVTAEIIDKEKDTKKTIYLNLNLNDRKKWIISSFLDPTIGLADNSSFPKEKFRTENFDSLNFEILIPKNFSNGQRNGSQITYVLAGVTQRDAAIQVDNFVLKAPVDILSYNWVNYVVNKYEHSDIMIKYLPYGYKYEYTVKDQDGQISKGITVAFESKGRFVYIQYFSFMDTYNEIWTDIDLMIRKLKIE